MKSPQIEKSFLRDLDAQIQEQSIPFQDANSSSVDKPEEYKEMLSLAVRLSQADFSQDSSIRQALRSSLLERSVGRQPRWHWKEGILRLSGWTITAVALVILALGLSWAFKNLLPSSGQPAGGSELNPSPTPIPPLSLDMPIEEIVGRMSSPLWQALWVDGTDTVITSDGQPETTYTQAWLDRSGRGRVIISDPQPGMSTSPIGIPPRWVWTSDGQNSATYDLFAGAYDPNSGLYGYAAHPLENAGEFMQLLFPYYINGRGGIFQAVSEDTFAGHPALVVEWRPDANSPIQDRFWVDRATGFLLRRVRMLEDGNTVEDVQVRSIIFDLPLPDSLAGAGGLDTVRFTNDPQEVTVPPEFLPLPTPVQPVEPTAPAVEIDSTLLILEPVSDPVYTGEPGSGDMYISLRKPGDAVDLLLRVDDVCLSAGLQSCPVVPVEFPSLAWSPLFWSPDGSQAMFLDSNNVRLVRYDPQTRQWSTVFEPFYATAAILHWSPDGAWIATTIQNGDASLVTLISADGVTSLQVAPDLGGTQETVGWLDQSRLLFTRYKDIPKGQVGTREEPRLYLYDLVSGVWSETAVNFQHMYPVLSPDRTKLAIAMNKDNQDLVEIYNLSSETTTHTGILGMSPAWSPDSNKIALLRWVGDRYEVHIVALEEGAIGDSTKVFEWAGYPLVTWAKDGQHLVIEAGPAGEQPASEMFLVSLADLSVRRLQFGDDATSIELRYPSFRP